MCKKWMSGRSLAMILVISIAVFLILASAPAASAKGRPDDREHLEHPEHPVHPDHPDNPGDGLGDVEEGDDPASGGAEDPISSGVGEGSYVATEPASEVAYVNNVTVRAGVKHSGTEGGISASVGYAVPLPSTLSSEASQLAFFTVSTISVFVSCVSMVSIFGKRPVPFATVWELRDAIFRERPSPRLGGNFKIR